jgi:mono/diheme cytochrome c family protein/plastocyanin
MGIRRLDGEAYARLALGLVGIALPLAIAAAWWGSRVSSSIVTVHGSVSRDGGWAPETIRAVVGSPLHLRLIADDVLHGFAVGRRDDPSVDMPPGQVVETTLIFDEPGTYTYYCTRSCGPDHWRMRGVIEVSGDPPAATAEVQDPMYVTLGIDIDSPHPAEAVPSVRPSADRGEALGIQLPEGFRSRQDFIRRPPADTWHALRRDPATRGLSDTQVWDLVAHLWRSTTTDGALRQGQELFAQNCAACHGASGAGDGVMASALGPTPSATHVPAGHLTSPANFTDPNTMLGASSALLQGKILRGGMGSGMPYWGPIFTESQMWALVDFLWTFQFEELP